MKALEALLKVRHELANTPLLQKGLEEADQHLMIISELTNKYPPNVNVNAKAADVGCISLVLAMSKFKSSFLDLTLLTVALTALIVSIGFVYPNIVTIFSLSAVWFTMMYMMHTIVRERAISLGAHNYIGRMFGIKGSKDKKAAKELFLKGIASHGVLCYNILSFEWKEGYVLCNKI